MELSEMHYCDNGNTTFIRKKLPIEINVRWGFVVSLTNPLHIVNCSLPD